MSDTQPSTEGISDSELVKIAATAGFDKGQWRAMFYETGPYDITVPTVEMRNLVRLIREQTQSPEPRAEQFALWPVKDIPYGVRVRYPGQPRVYTILDKGGAGVIAEYRDPPERGWIGQGIWAITKGENCLSFMMEVLGAQPLTKGEKL
jgi:hypothetical protein